jgi:hypothetical protein
MLGIEPSRQRLQGATATSAAHPQVPGRMAPAGLGAHAVEMSWCRHVHPAGWCSQERQESNLVFAGFGDQPPSRWLAPMHLSPYMKTARRACPLRAASGRCLSLSGSLREHIGPRLRGRAHGVRFVPLAENWPRIHDIYGTRRGQERATALTGCVALRPLVPRGYISPHAD